MESLALRGCWDLDLVCFETSLLVDAVEKHVSDVYTDTFAPLQDVLESLRACRAVRKGRVGRSNSDVSNYQLGTQTVESAISSYKLFRHAIPSKDHFGPASSS